MSDMPTTTTMQTGAKPAAEGQAAQTSLNEVATPCNQYRKMFDKWVLSRTLLGGTEAMRHAGTRWLPQAPKESDAAYEHRRASSWLFNGYTRILGTLSGKPFKKDIQVGSDVPPVIGSMLENVDRRGSHLKVFAGDVFHALLQDGSVHILTDFPEPPERPMKTLADEMQRGARPYWIIVRALDLIGWRHEYVDGRPRLMQCRIHEQVTEYDATGFKEEVIDQIRVLEPGYWAIYRKDKDTSNWYVWDEGDTTLSEIPLTTIKARGGDLMTAEPPLQAVAEQNTEHWQSSSDQRNILHVVRCPILVGAGFADDDLVVGPNSMIVTQDPNASLRYVEHQGAAIEAGKNDIDSIENKMATMGLELLRAPSPLTATQAEIENQGNQAELVVLASALEDGLENAMTWMLRWMSGPGAAINDEEGAGSLTVYKDFQSEGTRQADITTLLQARQLGDISRPTFLNGLKDRGVFRDDFDPEAEEESLTGETIRRAKLDEALAPEIPPIGSGQDPGGEGDPGGQGGQGEAQAA